MDLPQSDCGVFPLGFIYLHASSLPFLMGNIFIIKSALSDCFSGPDFPRENQPAEAEQAHETALVPPEDAVQPGLHTEPRGFLPVWLLWLGEALHRGLDGPVHHGLPPGQGESASLRVKQSNSKLSDWFVFVFTPWCKKRIQSSPKPKGKHRWFLKPFGENSS